MVRTVNDTTPVSSVTWQHRRYGVLSEVWVRDRGKKAGVEKVVNEQFKASGGQSRRMITMPEKSNYQAMRYQGEYQLERSKLHQLELELELPLAFAAWPGDVVQIERKDWGFGGSWRVIRAVVSMDGGGYRTRLELLPPDIML